MQRDTSGLNTKDRQLNVSCKMAANEQGRIRLQDESTMKMLDCSGSLSLYVIGLDSNGAYAGHLAETAGASCMHRLCPPTAIG